MSVEVSHANNFTREVRATFEAIRYQECPPIGVEYQKTHDVSEHQDEVAGIDPQTGRIWFGNSGVDIAHQQTAEGEIHPLYMVTVGKEYFVFKGGRR